MTSTSISRTLAASEQGEAVVRALHLTKIFGSRKVVERLSFTVYRGDIYGFLGPNGAGKTTTIRMLLGLVMPTDGHVELFGKLLTSTHLEALPQIGALVETPALYPYLTGRDNLRAVALALGCSSRQRIEEILWTVGLANRQNDRVNTYSLGMKQRLAVGIALLNNPELLILDEPANGLDPAGIVEMRDLLRNLSMQGKTVILSSHVLSEVQQICKRVGIMDRGRIIAEGSVDELTRTGGQNRYIVSVDDAPNALQALHAQAWGSAAILDPQGRLITPSPDGRGCSLNAFLIERGFIADSIMHQEITLEEVFLRLTNPSVGGLS